MSERLMSTWRDGISLRLGRIEQGLKDLGQNFDAFCHRLEGNGQPGRCGLEKLAHEALADRVRILENAHERRAWLGTLAGVLRAVAGVIAAAVILGLLRHYFHWM